MNADNELDAYLRQQLEVAPLPDLGFTSALVIRMERQQRRRRFALIGAGVVATALAGIALILSPASADLAITPGTIVAALLLATLCGLAWIGTESGLSSR
ncbi:hypothetical protein [Lysobacter sp. CFH 32150]|uniref:hypothetical protein n=1 Tax=Lysobacter sp. CFH 32150 TaxID=2927128 RepID=UPI001FA72C6E|nr:hypothetical protein [Lysobacter sp. CFH 32150]MCI4567962.1 hypothetical protein [Lysobacter sp. CFH 32150]